MCSEIVEELNSSKFTTNYFLYNGTFWCRVWCFLVFGAPALSVLPLLIFLVFVRDITEDILRGVSVTLVTVPIAAVSILVCCYYRKNVPKVSHSYSRIMEKRSFLIKRKCKSILLRKFNCC